MEWREERKKRFGAMMHSSSFCIASFIHLGGLMLRYIYVACVRGLEIIKKNLFEQRLAANCFASCDRPLPVCLNTYYFFFWLLYSHLSSPFHWFQNHKSKICVVILLLLLMCRATGVRVNIFFFFFFFCAMFGPGPVVRLKFYMCVGPPAPLPHMQSVAYARIHRCMFCHVPLAPRTGLRNKTYFANLDSARARV